MVSDVFAHDGISGIVPVQVSPGFSVFYEVSNA